LYPSFGHLFIHYLLQLSLHPNLNFSLIIYNISAICSLANLPTFLHSKSICKQERKEKDSIISLVKSLFIEFWNGFLIIYQYFLSLRVSEVHLFFNSQLFYWHFLEFLWLLIFLVFYKSFPSVLLSFFLCREKRRKNLSKTNQKMTKR